jgi:hypothetical protein
MENIIVIKNIEKELKVLIGKPLSNIGRAGNLLWLSFGEKIAMLDMNGCEVFKEKFALHIQCSWRLTIGSRIIVGSQDFYIPRTGLSEDEFNWDIQGANRFDERINAFKEMPESNTKVVEFFMDEFGGVKISFDSGAKLEVFPDDSLEEEFWRFIEFGEKSKHFVVFDKI